MAVSKRLRYDLHRGQMDPRVVVEEGRIWVQRAGRFIGRRQVFEVWEVRDEPEEWRPVPDYEGLYEVSDLGHVRSVRRTVIDSRGVPRTFPSRNLRPRGGNPGYREVTLYRDGIRWQVRAHVLVALAFIGPRPLGMEVAHRNGNPSNNRLTNLRYATPASNSADRIAHGTSNHGARNGNARLSDADVEDVKQALAAGQLQREIAARYGVTRTTISAIATGRSWKLGTPTAARAMLATEGTDS
jgi:hypothetical protein